MDDGMDALPDAALDAAESDPWSAAGGDSVTAAAALQPFPSLSLDAQWSTVTKSYEELCAEHVAAYLRSAEQYLASSVLSRRVLEWQERILPLLEEEEQHPPYDINVYGKEILNTIQEHKPENGGQRAQQVAVVDAATGSVVRDDSVVVCCDALCSLCLVLDFAEAVQGKQRYEICRCFLAALQLVSDDIRTSTRVPSTHASQCRCHLSLTLDFTVGVDCVFLLFCVCLCRPTTVMLSWHPVCLNRIPLFPHCHCSC